MLTQLSRSSPIPSQVNQLNDVWGEPAGYIESIEIVHLQIKQLTDAETEVGKSPKERASLPSLHGGESYETHFRGVEYDYTPAPVEAQNDAIYSKYRKAAFKFRNNLAKVPVLKSALDLIYRGIHYKTGIGQLQNDAVTYPALHSDVNLVYRGTQYTVKANQAESVTASVDRQRAESLDDLVRELVIQFRQKTERREQSVLERFEESVNVPDHNWVDHDRHGAAMS